MRRGLEDGFVVSRRFDAPRDLVWKAFTEPEHLAHWWGSEEELAEVVEFDLRPGGVFCFRMRSAAGGDIWGKWLYREVVAPERIEFVASFTDRTGESREIVSTVIFSETRGKTLVTNRSKLLAGSMSAAA